VPFKVTVRPVTGRIRAAIGAGLLLVAVGASACSPNSSSPGRSLSISVNSTSRSVHPSTCTLNASGTQAVATGSFSPSASLPIVDGQQVGALQLQLTVVSSKSLRVGHMVVHNPGLGETVAGVSVGQTSWHLATSVERLPGVRPTRCEVTYGVFR
jgi:hypothetical protein